MSASQFTIPYQGSPSDLFLMVSSAIEKNRGKLKGDEKTGGFEISTALGLVKCAYVLRDNEVVVDVLEKPIWLDSSVIESKLKDYIERSSRLPLAEKLPRRSILR